MHYHGANWNIRPSNKLIILSTGHKIEGYKSFDANYPGANEYQPFGSKYFTYLLSCLKTSKLKHRK